MGIGGTMVLGLVGSIIGGFLGYVLFHKDKPTRARSSRPASSARSSAPIIALLVYRASGPYRSSSRRVH